MHLFKMPVPERGFFVKNENNSVCPPPGPRLAAIFVQPTTCKSLKARLSFICIKHTYALYTNSQDKCMQYFINFICTEKWVGCKHFKSYIFEVFVDINMAK